MKKFEKLKVWYIKNYTALAKHYLEKLDATKFLNIYATKKINILCQMMKI